MYGREEVLRRLRGERSAFVRPRIQTHVIVPVVTYIFVLGEEVTLALSAVPLFDNSFWTEMCQSVENHKIPYKR